MDGFRADFIERGLTPTIAKLSKRGVYAPYIKPSYPTITFPNHYTIVTVSNLFVVDLESDERTCAIVHRECVLKSVSK